jgi:hypothetical protein
MMAGPYSRYVYLKIERRTGDHDKWASEENFTGHTESQALHAKLACALGAANCCLTMTVESFEPADDETRRVAAVESQCTREGCPNINLVTEAAFSIYDRARDGFLEARTEPPF